MKVKLFDRVLLAILLIIVVALCISLILFACRVFSITEMQRIVESLYDSDIIAISLGIGSAVLLIIALRLLFSGGKKKEPVSLSTLVKTTELGSTFIALSALDCLVQKHCRSITRIRATVSSVHAVREGGITINLRLSLMPDSNIPELTVELQKSLKEYVESLSGITVREIGILVEDTSSNPKARVD